MLKEIRKNSLFLLIVIFLTLFLVLKDDFAGIIDILFDIDLIWLFFSLILLFCHFLFKTFGIYCIAKEYTKKIRCVTLFKQTIITQFFNGITPFSTGGQPMQIYMLNKQKISLAKSTNIIFQDFMAYQIALVISGVLAILVNDRYKFLKYDNLILKLVILGFLVNLLVCISLFIICFCKRVTKIILYIVHKVVLKFNVFGDKEKLINAINDKVSEFHESTTLLSKNKLLFLKCILFNFISIIFLHLITYFLIIGMFGPIDINIIGVIVCSIFVLLVGAFVPIPGGTGGIEYAFVKFMGVFFVENKIMALLLIWRFITYYVGMILGAIMVCFYKEGE